MESDYRTLSEIESLVSSDPEFPFFYVMRANYYSRKSLKEKVRGLEIKHSCNLPYYHYPILLDTLRKKIHSLTVTNHDGDPDIQQDSLARYVLRDLKIALNLLESAITFQIGLSKNDFTETLKSKPSNSFEFVLRAVHINSHFSSTPTFVDQLLNDCNQAIALSPHNFLALEFIATTYANHIKDPEKAITYYVSVLVMFPKDSKALSGRGRSYFNLRDYHKSIKDINSALEIINEINCEYKEVNKYSKLLHSNYYARALSYSKLGAKPKAIECFTEITKHYPEHHRAFYKRGELYLSFRKFYLALKDFTTSLSIKSDLPNSLKGRAVVYVEIGEFELALKDASKLIEITKENEMAIKYALRGLVYLNLERFEEAIIDVTNGIKFGYSRCTIYRQAVVKKLKEKIMKM